MDLEKEKKKNPIKFVEQHLTFRSTGKCDHQLKFNFKLGFEKPETLPVVGSNPKLF